MTELSGLVRPRASVPGSKSGFVAIRRGDDEEEPPPEGVMSGFSLKTAYRPRRPTAPAEAYLFPLL